MLSVRHLDAFPRGRIIGKLEEGRSRDKSGIAAESSLELLAHSLVSRLWRQILKLQECSYPGRLVVVVSTRNHNLRADDRPEETGGSRQRRKNRLTHDTGDWTTDIAVLPWPEDCTVVGLFARRPVRCVPLTPAHRRRRSLWCRNTGIGETMNGDGKYSLQMRAEFSSE
ncbi:hypothetical protein TNCV_2648451 [Trichonephila clavipes]|nr:hypothetical protein TNCV_2648451 [Trichonephila clavipes]